MLKKVSVLLIAFCFFAVGIFSSVPKVNAQPPSIQKIYYSAGYGGLLGGLLGAAIMVLGPNPNDHWDYILKGAAIGVIGGTLYGIIVYTQPPYYGLVDYSSNTGLNFHTPQIAMLAIRDNKFGVENRFSATPTHIRYIPYVNVFAYHF